MERRYANIVMVSSTLGLAHVLVLGGCIFPSLYAAVCRLEASYSIEDVMLAPTKFAVHHMWVFIALLVLVGLAAILLNQQGQRDRAQTLVCGLCLQGLVVWSMAFCLFYDAVTGPMCLHHGPSFEWRAFFIGAMSIFPVTLCCLIAPMGAMLLWKQPATSEETG